MWNAAGLVAALAVAAIAFVRSRTTGGFYDADVYGMTANTHRRYGAIAAAFSVVFLVTFAPPLRPAAVWAFAAFVPFALFYLTSFLRGAHEDDDERD